MVIHIVVAVVVTAIVLGVGAASTSVGSWYRGLNKPAWNPPDWVFGPAWTLILGLAAWAGVIGWDRAKDGAAVARLGLLFGANIALHMLWSPLFFNMRRPDWALLEVPLLWLSILALMTDLAPTSALAAALLVPYLLWVSFAAFLNLTIVRLNAPFSVGEPPTAASAD